MAYRYREFDWYQTPLYYDIVFDAETPRECDFLERMYQRYAPGGSRRVLEPACGSGRLVAAMARRGYDVTGFDKSEGALSFARRRWARTAGGSRGNSGLGAVDLAIGDMQSFRFKNKFDMAHCLVSSFRYLLGEDEARSHLECVAASLRRGGVYILGFHLSQYEDRSIGRERWVASRGGVHVVCNIQGWPADRRRRREAMRSRLVVTRRGQVTRYETRWEFRSYSARQFRALLARIPGLSLVATFDFDYDPDRPRTFGRDRLDQVVILRRDR